MTGRQERTGLKVAEEAQWERRELFLIHRWRRPHEPAVQEKKHILAQSYLSTA